MEPQKPTPGSASVYNHILQYTTQKRESQHRYTTFTPSHCAPTEPSRNIPPPPQSKQSWPLPEYGAFHYHPTPHFSPRLPLSGSAGSRRSRFIQQSAVWSGPAQHARPSHAAGRLGADSPNNRNATVAPRGGRETFIIDRVYAQSHGLQHLGRTRCHTILCAPLSISPASLSFTGGA